MTPPTAAAARAEWVHKVRKAGVLANVGKRPPSYLNEVKAAAAREDDTFFHVPDAAYRALREKYSPTRGGRRAHVVEWGPPKWAALHGRALAYAGDPAAELDWLRHLAAGLPDGVCQCRSHWYSLVQERPPDLASAAAYFAWTVWAHDRVNVRLRKPAFGAERAAKRWERPR